MSCRVGVLWFLVVMSVVSTQGDLSDNLDSSLSDEGKKILTQRVNDLGFRILKNMAEQNGGTKNIVISPTSIAGLLAMALLGSVGDTFDEIVRAVGFSSDALMNQKHHTQFGALLDSLNFSNETKTAYANAIFVDEKEKLRTLYKHFTERVYHGSVDNLNFHDSVAAVSHINKWVSEHTNDMIPEFLTNPLPAETKVVLLSALYFSGQWKTPFTPEFTKNMTFTKTNGTKVEAELMLNYGQFKYYSSNDLDCHIIALPYKGNDTTMYAVMPRRHKTQSITELLNKLDTEKIDNLINELKQRTCVIRFPKMKLSHRSNLKDSLKALGIHTMFTDSANFALMIDSKVASNDDDAMSRMSSNSSETGSSLREALSRLPNPGVSINTIIHEVQMNINEFGTEASAVTAGFLTRSAEMFYTFSPFYFFIRNEQTKLVTFSSIIFDPTQAL